MNENAIESKFIIQQKMEEISYEAKGQLALIEVNTNYLLEGLEEVSLWELSNYSAVEFWLTDYNPEPNSSKLEVVVGYLESFYHLTTLNDWQNAWLIASSKLNTPNSETLFEQLGIWGYYKEVIENIEVLLEKISIDVDAYCYLFLGNAIQLSGDRDSAKTNFEKSLKCAQDSDNIYLEGRVLVNIGNLYRLRKDYNQALSFFDRSLKITRTSCNRLWEAVALSFQALVFNALGDYDSAKECYLLSIEISSAPDVNNLQWQSNALTNLASVYRETGEFFAANSTLEKGLLLAQETGDRYAEGWAWYQLGLLREKQMMTEESKDCLMNAYTLFSDLGNPSGQETVSTELERIQNLA